MPDTSLQVLENGLISPLRSLPSSLTTGRGYVKNPPLKLAGFVDNHTPYCVRQKQALGDGKRRQSEAREAQTDRTE
jgi:hypothetical protein